MSAFTGRGSSLALAAVLTLYFFSLGYAIVTPAMAEFAKAFPDKEYALINSLPLLFVGAAGLVMGFVAGKKVSCRTLAITGSTLAFVGGITPAFLNNFELILLCRAVHGIGMGLLIPLANALVNGNYDGDGRAKLLSIGFLLLNAGGVILQFLGGFFAEPDWHNTFLVYTSFAAALVMSFFIPEMKAAESTVGTTKGIRMGKGIWILVLLFAVYGMFQFSVMQNTAELFELRHAGGSSESGLALSVFTVAGCIGGLCYMPIRKTCARAVFPVLWVATAVGTAVIASFDGGVMMTAGLAVLGFGFGMIIPAFIEWTSGICSAATIAIGTAIVTSSLYLGDFVSMAWKFIADALFGEHIVSNLWVMTAYGVILCVAFLIRSPFGRGCSDD